MLRMLAVAEVFIQGAQQALLGVGGGGPVDQGVLLQRVQLLLQTERLDGAAHFTFAEDAAGRGIQAVEEQPARRRIRAVASGVGAEHRVHRADRQGIRTAFGGRTGQVLQGQGVAEATIAEAAQRVQLGTQAPGTGGLAVDGFGDAVAVGGGDGEGEGLVVDVHAVVAEGDHAGQHRVAIEAQLQGFAVFQADAAQGVGFEVARQVQAVAAVDGQQRRQVFVLLLLFQFQQAGVYLCVGVGRVPQAFEHGAQGIGCHALRTAVGVDPIDGKARTAGEDFQVRFAQECSPTGERLTRALYGGSCAPCSAGVAKITCCGAG
ncbi:hypothetical protein ALP39_04884 [Pseudomonas marginalis pv. marginalis]|nr:hypothetical protein ALP39_04884 [Pseudomonas marginalis pv. marginalis]